MSHYVPGSNTDWERAQPSELGLDETAIEEAVAFALQHESKMDRDIGRALDSGHFSEPMPEGETLGPTEPRSDPSGLIVKNGRIVAEWGPTMAPDMTFSVAKSYLSVLTGLAVQDGLIGSVHDKVGDTVKDGGFEGAHNGAITWEHLLQMTSEWEGTLWGKPDLIDRNRRLDLPPNTPSAKGTHRDLTAPGGFWEYNDVRVNRLSLALMRVFGRPLPEILKNRVMDPIGASDQWRWEGYRNSWVEIDGERMQSVPGGAHWGGGLFIPSRDHARLGLLMARKGLWGDRRILNEDWVDACTKPAKLNESYGYLWWLNGALKHCPSAPRSSVFAMGVGSNVIWWDADHDLVAVIRWIDKGSLDGFAARLTRALG
jgi:CubicO group peptidase (beta-lactamase class C family)